jgi:uncharacterized protein
VFRVLIWLMLGWVLYRALGKLMGKGTPDSGGQKREGEEMVCDPQCGVYIPQGSAIKRRIKGDTVFFCSRECVEKYREKARM